MANSGTMSIFHYIPLLGGIFNFALSLFVLGCDRRSRVNQVFAAWGIGIAIWNLGTFAMFRVNDHDNALMWARLLQYGVIVLPPTLLHLSLILAGQRVGKWIFWLYIMHAGLMVMNACGYFISDVRNVGYAWYSIAGPGFWIYSVSLTQTFASVFVLWRKSRTLLPRQRQRLKGILVAQALIVIFGTNDILPIIGIDHYPMTSVPILPYGSLAAVAYGIMVAYSVFQHQLLDVHLALGQSAAYLVRFAFLLLIAVVLELFVGAFAPPGTITTFALVSTILVITLSALIASFLFPKLLGSSAESLERRLLGDHFEYQDKMRAFTENLRWHTELSPLLNELHTLLVNTVRVRAYWIILLDETNRAFTLTRAHPDQPQHQLPDLRSDSPVFRFFADKTQDHLSLNTGSERSNPESLEAKACEQLRAFVGDIAFPLLVDDQPHGLLILGEKTNGAPFTRNDTQLLVSLTQNLALVANQISLKNQILLNQELDLLGRMSRGMAHDLNNLNTPVWTLLQLFSEGCADESARTELAPVAIRNIQTMRAYIREALFFSENLRPDIQLGRLDVLIQNVADLARENKRNGKEITYRVETSGETLVEMDTVLIQRLIANIVSNAVDASSDVGEVRIELIRLVKTDAARDWLRVRVTDRGTGIRTEDMSRIFQPYFTTKRTGDEGRGFGLGLAICRKIATLHGGSLTLTSEIGKGTVVNLDLPNRQKNARNQAFQPPGSIAANTHV